MICCADHSGNGLGFVIIRFIPALADPSHAAHESRRSGMSYYMGAGPFPAVGGEGLCDPIGWPLPVLRHHYRTPLGPGVIPRLKIRTSW
jgi:hypothetical protein